MGIKPSEVFDRLVKEGNIDGYTKVSNDVRIRENPVQLGGTEDISFDWGNNRQGRPTHGGTFKRENRSSKTPERTLLNGKQNEIPTLNGRENPVQLGGTEDISFDWGNNRQGRGTGIENFEENIGSGQHRRSFINERGDEIPTLNGRENPVQLGGTGKGKEGFRNTSSITSPSDLPDAKTDIPKLESGKKVSQTYTNTGKNGGGWNKDEYANYTDPNYQYDTISERESVEAAQQMRADEGREPFKDRVMGKERVTSQELDGLMLNDPPNLKGRICTFTYIFSHMLSS